MRIINTMRVSYAVGAINLADAQAIREALDQLPASTRKKLEQLVIELDFDSPEAEMLYSLIMGEGL